LDLLLGSHSTAFSLGEIHRILKVDSNQKLCDLCNDDCDIWTNDVIEKIQNTSRLNFFQKNLAKLNFDKTTEVSFYDEIFKATNKNVLIDSSKNTNWISKNDSKLQKSNKYKPYLIYLSRDGRAVINSFYRKKPQVEISNFANRWNRKIEKINDCFNYWSFDDKLHIKYKDLATEPVATINNILALIDEDYEPEMMGLCEHKDHSVNGNAGTKSLILKFQEESRHKKIDWNLNKKCYFKNHELGIKFDERWRKELSENELKKINNIIGQSNEQLIK
jgi:hypothetical protein